MLIVSKVRAIGWNRKSRDYWSPLEHCLAFLKIYRHYPSGNIRSTALAFWASLKFIPFRRIYIYSYDFLFLDETYHSGKLWCFLGGWRYIKIASIDIDAFVEKNQKYLEENIIRTFICCNHLIYLLKSSM